MSPKQLTALRLLAENPEGLYGSELAELSAGRLTRGTVYTTLERMVADKYVREVEEPASPKLRLPRTKHFITAEGKRAYAEFLDEHRAAAPQEAAPVGCMGGTHWKLSRARDMRSMNTSSSDACERVQVRPALFR